MAYIPFDKMNKLREASKTGDERARKILLMQMNGEDFGQTMDEYFKAPSPAAEPVAEQKATEPEADYSDITDEKLVKFLKYNGVKKGDPEYEDTIESYYQEFPKARPHSENIEEQADETDIDVQLPEDNDDSSIYGSDDEDIPEDEPQPAVAQAEEKSCIDVLIDDEYEAISGYDKAISEVMKMELGDAVKSGVISKLEEIRKDEYEHVDELKRLKASIEKKEEQAQF